MQNMKQIPMKHEAKQYYGPFIAPQIHTTNANMKIILSTVYPTVIILFYIVKNYYELNRHVHTVPNHD